MNSLVATCVCSVISITKQNNKTRDIELKEELNNWTRDLDDLLFEFRKNVYPIWWIFDWIVQMMSSLHNQNDGN